MPLFSGHFSLAVIGPQLAGPLQTLLAILPGLLLALGGSLLALFKPSTAKKLVMLLWVQKIPVAVIAGVVAGIVYFYPRVFASHDLADAASVQSGNAQWPLWRGSIERRGAALDGEDPAHGRVQWSFTPEGTKAFFSSPAVAGNRIYIASAKPGFEAGAVYSLDADTGKIVWQFNGDGYRATFSSPAISGKYLVVGEGLHKVNDGRLFCFDLEASEKQRRGVKLWSRASTNHVESSPAVDDGRVCFGAGDDGLYCIDLAPNPDGTPHIQWHLPHEKYKDCESSPLIHQGKVYFCLGNEGQAVCCVDLATHEELWRINTPYTVFGAPAISGNKLFVGMGTGDYIKSDDDLKLPHAGEVWCIDLTTHAVLWKFPAGRTILGAVAVADDRVYFGSQDKCVYCISTEGKLLHKWDSHETIVASCAVGQKHVYVMTRGGQLYGLDLNKFEPVWHVDLTETVNIANNDVGAISSPAVAHGHVYVGTTSHGLVCAGLPGELPEKPIWAGRLGGPGKSGLLEGSLLSDHGEWAGRFPDAPEADDSDEADADSGQPAATVHGPVAYLDGGIYAGVDQQKKFGLARLLPDPKTGKLTQQWYCETKHPISVSPAAASGAVYFVEGQAGDADRALHCVNPADGQPLGSHSVDAAASGQFLLADERLLIADRATGLSCLKPGGKLESLWSRDVGPIVGAPLIVGDLAFVAVGSPAELVALDLPTGEPLWHAKLATESKTGPIFCASLVWLGTAAGISGHDLVDGQVRQQVSSPSVAAPLVCDANRIAFIDEERQLHLIDAATAHEALKLTDVAAGLTPVLAGDSMLYCDGKSILTYDLTALSKDATLVSGPADKDNKQQWLATAWLGQITAPLVVVESDVYFCTDKKGLVRARPKKH